MKQPVFQYFMESIRPVSLFSWLQISAWATLGANDSHLTDIYFQIEVEMTWEPATIIKKMKWYFEVVSFLCTQQLFLSINKALQAWEALRFPALREARLKGLQLGFVPIDSEIWETYIWDMKKKGVPGLFRVLVGGRHIWEVIFWFIDFNDIFNFDTLRFQKGHRCLKNYDQSKIRIDQDLPSQARHINCPESLWTVSFRLPFELAAMAVVDRLMTSFGIEKSSSPAVAWADKLLA